MVVNLPAMADKYLLEETDSRNYLAEAREYEQEKKNEVPFVVCWQQELEYPN